MPPASPVPGWSSGEVCTDSVATRRGRERRDCGVWLCSESTRATSVLLFCPLPVAGLLHLPNRPCSLAERDLPIVALVTAFCATSCRMALCLLVSPSSPAPP